MLASQHRHERVSPTPSFCLTIVLMVCCIAIAGYTQDAAVRTCSLKGTVFVGDPGSESYIAKAQVLLNGPVMDMTETDEDGNYVFDHVPPGTYMVEASFETLKTQLTITLEPSQTIKLPIQLTLSEVKTSVTVTATDATAVSPAPTEIINEKLVDNAPNVDEQFQSLLPLVPGVVRGPDGLMNLKGSRNAQSGALVNSANVTDPATGSPAISLPIDVVSSVKVISNPYDPEYGKLTGAVSNVETKTGNFDDYHFSIQNIMPRPRVRDGSIIGLASATPRMTFTGPLIKDRLAVTESFEYRFVRTPVNSETLPPLQRDIKLEGFNWFSQYDLTISPKQTATVSVAVYPQKLDFLGLNTFTPQPSTGDFHQRGYQLYGQDHYLFGSDSVLTSQLSFKRYDVDVTAQNNDPYQLLVDTTEGGFFNRQARRATRFDGQEIYQMAPKHFLGTHQVKLGLEYSHSTYNGRETFLPVELIGADNQPIERLTFTAPTYFGTDQNEVTSFAEDQWSPWHRLTLDLGLRFDSDSVTSSAHAAPRVGFLLALTKDGKTLLKGGAGLFYDRVPLMYPVFEQLPDRTVTLLGPSGQPLSSNAYVNRIGGGLQNPRSTAWNLAIERLVTERFTLRLAYEQRNTARDFVVYSRRRERRQLYHSLERRQRLLPGVSGERQISSAPNDPGRILCSLTRLWQPERSLVVLRQLPAGGDTAGCHGPVTFRRSQPGSTPCRDRWAVEADHRPCARCPHRFPLFRGKRISRVYRGAKRRSVPDVFVRRSSDHASYFRALP